MNQRVVPFVQAFIAGFVSTLVFHQGVLALLYLAHAVPHAPYDLRALPPLGLPAVISLAFWGGVWGATIWSLLRHVGSAASWVWAVLIGAIGPSAVALFIVYPLKGMPVAGGWDPKLLGTALLLNGAWGLGLALLMRLLHHAPSRGDAGTRQAPHLEPIRITPRRGTR
jgi:hypothetical protein